MSEAGDSSGRESESESSVTSLEGDGGLDELWTTDDDMDEEEWPGPGGDATNGPWIRLLDPADFQPRRNFNFDAPTGPINPPRYDADPSEFFLHMSSGQDEDLVGLLVRETNRFALQCNAQNWSETTEEEMKAFLGLLLMMGVVKKPSLKSYWTSDWLLSTPCFGQVLPRDRFLSLWRHLHVSNNAAYPIHGQPGYDPTHKIVPLIDLLNETFSSKYNLGRDLCVDESMIGFKGHHALVQYLRFKKSHQWGPKFWILAESDTGYVARMLPYKGKRYDPTLAHPQGISYATVHSLAMPYFGKGHHITTDSFFSSPALAHDLYSEATYFTGTIRVHRRGMPRTLKEARLQRGETVAMQQGPLMALKMHDRSVVTFLSTYASGRLVGAEEEEVMEVVRKYNFTMQGVDRNDQLVHSLEPTTKCMKLYKRVIINCLCRVVVNAYIVYKQVRFHRHKLSHMEFHTNVARGLIGTYRARLPMPIQPRHNFARLAERHFPSWQNGKRRRECAVCGRKRRSWCSDCGVGLCIDICFRRYHTLVRPALAHPQV